MYSIGTCQLRKEYILSAFYDCSVNKRGTAYACLPERYIENMMKTERYKSPFYNSVNKSSAVSGTKNETADGKDTPLYNGPDKEKYYSDKKVYGGAYNRNKTCSAEESEYRRKLCFVISVMKPCSSQTDDNTAEHACLQCGYAEICCYRAAG